LIELPDFPFHAQERPYTCLPACLRMCLAYLGVEFAEDVIVAACATRARGTTLGEAVDGLERLGFTGETGEARTLDWLDEQLAGAQPVIVALLLGDEGGSGRLTIHAVVVVGADEQRVVYHDPQLGPRQSMSREEFLDRWDLTGGKALLIQT
jgi:ABC-type bacteriocin/lantibiotic exporter with double-glycine peptidase domain